MPIVFHNGKLLFTADGKLAMSANCCCDCLPSPTTRTFVITYSVGGTGCTQSLSFAQSELEVNSYGVASYWSISFTRRGGQTETLQKGGGEMVLSGKTCGSASQPRLEESVATDPTGTSFTITLTAFLTQPGTLAVTFRPGSLPYVERVKDEHGEPIPGSFKPGGAHRIDWACSAQVLLDSVDETGQYTPGYHVGPPGSYNTYTKTIAVN